MFCSSGKHSSYDTSATAKAALFHNPKYDREFRPEEHTVTANMAEVHDDDVNVDLSHFDEENTPKYETMDFKSNSQVAYINEAYDNGGARPLAGEMVDTEPVCVDEAIYEPEDAQSDGLRTQEEVVNDMLDVLNQES